MIVFLFGLQIETLSGQVSFNDDVRPILSNHCFACHGPDEATREAGLRLDVANDVDTAELLQRIASDDADFVICLLYTSPSPRDS